MTTLRDPSTRPSFPALRLGRPASPPRPIRLEAEPQPADLDLARTALVIVDMQNDFLHPDGWFPRAGVDVSALRALVPTLTRLAAAARAAGVPVIWLNWGVRADTAELSASILDKASAGGTRPVYADPSPSGEGRILVAGDWGADVIAELAPATDDLVVHKHRLSGFHDNELDSVLRNRGIETLLFAGVNTDRCVFSTLCDASFRSYGCAMIEDAVATPSPAYVTDAVLYLVRLLYGVTARTDAVISAFSAATHK